MSAGRPGRVSAAEVAAPHPDGWQSRLLKRRIDNRSACNYTVVMRDLRFEWDARKNEANRRKHSACPRICERWSFVTATGSRR
jgi:hypothetical protein